MKPEYLIQRKIAGEWEIWDDTSSIREARKLLLQFGDGRIVKATYTVVK